MMMINGSKRIMFMRTLSLNYYSNKLQSLSVKSLSTLIRDESFVLNKDYVESYSTKIPSFGFNGLGELVYMRTYSRVNSNNQKESWYQTVERVRKDI